ncbi:MAG: hypothetical protein RL060_47, partial [Bacteroidota bacterium]
FIQLFYLNDQRLSAQSAPSVFNFYVCFKKIHTWHADDMDLANFHGYINLCFQFIQLLYLNNQRLSAQSAPSVFNFYVCFIRIHTWHAEDTDWANFHGYINLCFQFIQLFYLNDQRLSAQSAPSVFNFYVCF